MCYRSGTAQAFAGCRFYVDPLLALRRMNATVLLARHASHNEVGKVLSGRSDIAISDAGHTQAAWLTARLASVPLAAIYSSPRRRARETAEIVAVPHRLAVQDAPGLDEIDFGAWAGRTFEALDGDPDWQRWNRSRATARTPGGEDMRDATARAVRHVEAVAGPAPVLCVSHGDILRGVVAHYLGLGMDRLLSFDVDPASLTELALYGDGSGRVVALNERPL